MLGQIRRLRDMYVARRDSRIFARKAERLLVWWLVGFGDYVDRAKVRSRVGSTSPLPESDTETLHLAVCRAATDLACELIGAQPEEIREEVAEYVSQASIIEEIGAISAQTENMFMDLIGLELEDPVRPYILEEIRRRHSPQDLSHDAQVLFAAVRHLWGRVMVVVDMAPDDERLMAAWKHLLDSTLDALGV